MIVSWTRLARTGSPGVVELLQRSVRPLAVVVRAVLGQHGAGAAR